MKHVFIFFLLAVAGGSCTSGDAQKVASAAETAGLSRIAVQVAEVTVEDIQETLLLTGTARSWDEFTVSSEVPGRMLAIHTEEGQFVEQGKLLLELDRSKRLLELKSRRLQLEKTKVELGFSQKKLARGEALLPKGAISASDLDVLKQGAQLAESAVGLAAVAVDLIEKELQDSLIFSPVSGQVVRRHVSLGETVAAGAPLFTIIQVDPLKVATEISATHLRYVRIGQAVRLVFEAFPQASYQGRIERVHPVANPQSGSFPVEIRLANSAGRLQPGMVARIEMSGPAYSRALLVPLDAVLDSAGKSHVFVVRDGLAYREPVVILRRLGRRAIVSGSLNAGDQVVTRGNANLTDRTPVEVVS